MEQSFTVEKCIHCGQRHTFLIKVEKAMPLFGGPGGEDAEWTFTCDVTQKIFSTKINIEKGFKVIGVVENSNPQHANKTGITEDSTKSEYQTWVGESRNRGLSYSSTMLTTSTGAIGIYFTIEKYLGIEKISGNVYSLVAFLPPVFYLIASLFFILALKPKFDKITSSEFDNFRLKRLERINFYNAMGLYSFLGGNFTAVIHFFSILK